MTGTVIEGHYLPAPEDSPIAQFLRENLIKNLLAHPTPIEHAPQRALPMTDHSDINDKDVNSYYWHLAPDTTVPRVDAGSGDLGTIRDGSANGPTDPMRVIAEQVLADDYATGAEYFDAIKRLVQNGQGQVAIQLIDSLPEHLKGMNQVGKGMVVLPDADNITEEMVDASRGLHLYYSTERGAVSSGDMRKHLQRYSPWSEQFWPEWFRESNDHLTKAGRSLLAYALTVAAHQNPNAKQLYFHDANERNTSERMRIWDKPFHQGVQLTFKKPSGVTGTLVEQFVIKRPFSQANLVRENSYQLVLNRNDLPKNVRQHFKQQAVRINMMLIEEGTKVVFNSTHVSYKGDVVLYDIAAVMASRW